MPLSLLIGLRFSRGRRRGGMVSLISVISTIGIALGVAVLIVGLSAMNGFERELNNRILAVVPHGEIEAVNQPWTNWQEALDNVQKVPGIAAAAPYINFTGLVESGANLRAIQVKGVNPQQEQHLSALPSFVQGDAWRNFKAGEQQIIIGKGVADALKVKQGDWVSIMIPNSNPEHKLMQPKRVRLHIAGILQLSGQLDHSFAMIPLADAQQYLDMGSSVSGIALKMTDVFNANKLVRDAGEVTNSYVILKVGLVLRLYVSRYPDDPRHYVSGDGTGDWRGLFQHRLHLSDGGERQEWRYRSIKNAGGERWFNSRHLCLVWIAGRAVRQPVWCDYRRGGFTATYPDY